MSKPQPSEDVEYASLRIIGDVHKLRFGGIAKLVEAGPGQRIVFRAAPFAHFQVTPAGVEIPLVNVASAIPMTAELAQKIRKTTGAKSQETHVPRVVKPVAGVEDNHDQG